MTLIYLIASLIVMSPSQANMGRAQGAAKSIIGATGNYTPRTVGDVPGFVGTDIPEAKLDQNSIESSKFEVASKDETYQMIKDSIEKRPPYEIDMANDPMIKASNRILENHEEAEVSAEEPVVTRHTCIRGQETYTSKCKRILVPHQTGTRLETRSHTVNLSGYQIYHKGASAIWNTASGYGKRQLSPDDPKVINAFKSVFQGTDAATGEGIPIDSNAIKSVTLSRSHGGTTQYFSEKKKKSSSEVSGPQYVEVTVVTQAEIPTFELIWEENCPKLEALIDSGHCDLIDSQCIGGAQTKVVQGVPLRAECWEEELTYQCHSPQKNTCTDLLKKGCTQVSSTCKTKSGDECIEWEQTFECVEKQSLAKAKLKWDGTPCLNGDCVDQSWEPNRDMVDSLSKLAMFKEMQKDMDPKTQTVFNGEPKQCSRVVAGIKNCCVQKGWGMKIGLASCDEKEKQLADLRNQNKCIQVGSYCIEKTLGKCIRKKTSFCCYESKLARIINEQGAKQLGLSFGTPEHPNCKILTLSNLTKIDFGKIDFSELFRDIATQTKIPNISGLTKDIQKSMEDKSRTITDKQKKITQGRSNDSF